MNAVAYYSATGESLAVAQFFSKRLDYPLLNIEEVCPQSYETLVLVFPVHSQNLPHMVKRFLQSVKIENLTAIATYGRMCCGNVLYEIQTEYGFNIIAAAYIPTKHCYKGDESFGDWESLTPVIDKVKHPSPVKLPKLYKNPFASLCPDLRSRCNVKIYRTSNCNGCGVCADNCPFNAISNGVTNNKCIRCLKCVNACPNHALQFKPRLPLRLYLKKEKMNELVIFV